MRIIGLTLALSLAAPAFAQTAPAPAPTAAATPATAAAYTTSDSTIGSLLENPATKAVLVKYIPDMVSNPQISMASGMTLKAVQSYAADELTDEKLAKIDAELAKIPAKK